MTLHELHHVTAWDDAQRIRSFGFSGMAVFTSREIEGDETDAHLSVLTTLSPDELASYELPRRGDIRVWHIPASVVNPTVAAFTVRDTLAYPIWGGRPRAGEKKPGDLR